MIHEGMQINGITNNSGSREWNIIVYKYNNWEKVYNWKLCSYNYKFPINDSLRSYTIIFTSQYFTRFHLNHFCRGIRPDPRSITPISWFQVSGLFDSAHSIRWRVSYCDKRFLRNMLAYDGWGQRYIYKYKHCKRNNQQKNLGSVSNTFRHRASN
jgi:hypothetical protein